jgi:hypothetical protein
VVGAARAVPNLLDGLVGIKMRAKERLDGLQDNRIKVYKDYIVIEHWWAVEHWWAACCSSGL